MPTLTPPFSVSRAVIESIQGIFHNVQLMTNVLHHAVDAAGVFKDVHTLVIGVVVDYEWTTDGLCKLPADTQCNHLSSLEIHNIVQYILSI